MGFHVFMVKKALTPPKKYRENRENRENRNGKNRVISILTILYGAITMGFHRLFGFSGLSGYIGYITLPPPPFFLKVSEKELKKRENRHENRQTEHYQYVKPQNELIAKYMPY